MTATKRKGGGKTAVRTVAESIAVGLSICLLLSLIGAAVAIKADNAIALETTVAAICVGVGAAFSTAAGKRISGNRLTGLYSGLSFLCVLVLLSLCFGGEGANPLPLFGAAAGGIAISLLLFRPRKRRVKKCSRR